MLRSKEEKYYVKASAGERRQDRIPQRFLLRQKSLNKIIFLALLVSGIVLIIIGVNAMNSFSSDVSRFFTGSLTDKTVWMLAGGCVAATIGLFGLVSGSKR